MATAATKTIRPHESNDTQAITGASYAISDVIRRLSIGDEVFMEPDRLVPFEHWLGHIPFAFWVTTALRPRRLVELGTHRGNSYCAFCQAITRASIDCAAYAVDTWQGDVHMASEQGLLDELRKYHDPRYGRFSKLIESTFDEASKHFSPGSIDLLHIDGTHTYDAVRADFETWRPMLSDRAVVLFHDINERQGNFGVWRVWEELALEFPHFAFSHSHGLGVLGVGSDLPGSVQALFNLEPDRAAHLRQMFAALGASMFRRLQSDTLTAALNEVEARANESLMTARAETDALTQSLSIAEIQKKDLSDQVAGLKGTVNDLDVRANEFESALKISEIQKKDLFDQVAGLKGTVNDLDARANELKSALNEAEAQKKALSRQVATIEATSNKLKSSLNYAEAQKKDLSGQVAGLEATANQLKSSLNYAEAQKNDLSEQVAMLNARAEELKSALNGAKAQNKALLDQVAMLDAVIAERDKKINTILCDEIALRAENEVLGKQLISALHSAHAFGTEVQTLRRSSSWKITRPLRVMARLVRGEWAELKHIRRIRRFGS